MLHPRWLLTDASSQLPSPGCRAGCFCADASPRCLLPDDPSQMVPRPSGCLFTSASSQMPPPTCLAPHASTGMPPRRSLEQCCVKVSNRTAAKDTRCSKSTKNVQSEGRKLEKAKSKKRTKKNQLSQTYKHHRFERNHKVQKKNEKTSTYFPKKANSVSC